MLTDIETISLMLQKGCLIAILNNPKKDIAGDLEKI